MNLNRVSWLALRFTMSFIFLWAFADKLLGLGFATKPASSWLHGGSPTSGFLSMATKGPLADIFKNLAGNPLIDWLFMLGVLCIGLSLLLNRYITLGASGGAVLMFLMWLATLFPANNPIIDEHIVYALALVLLGQHFRKRT